LGPSYVAYFGARSLHTGGVNLLLADGSVRFVNNHVNLVTWRALGSTKVGRWLETFESCLVQSPGRRRRP
jgi:prepilin-type processing-associated H-X9-DG protein